MRKFLLTICFSSFVSSITVAKPPLSNVFGPCVEEGMRYMTKRNLNSIRVTLGFKPPQQPKALFQKIEPIGKVRFLPDGEHYIPSQKIAENLVLKDYNPTITKENSHSVRVDLDQKKNE